MKLDIEMVSIKSLSLFSIVKLFVNQFHFFSSFIFQIFVQILANSIDITDVTMACVDGVTKLRISIPEDFKSFFKDGGSLVLRIQDPES